MIKNEELSNSKVDYRCYLIGILFFLIAGCAGTSEPATTEQDKQITQETVQPETPAADETRLSNDDDDLLFADIEEKSPVDEELLDDGLFDDSDESLDNALADDDLFSDDDSVAELQTQEVVSDPLYYFNKAMFNFNDKMYFWLLKPVANGYKAVTTETIRKGVRNFFRNLGFPIRFVNNTLQGKFKGAGSELGRFVVNSTVGVLGFADPAKHYLGLEPSREDLGQTLGSYGIGNGPYIVWPVFGPSTLRDSIGNSVDYYLHPVTYVQPELLSYGIRAGEKINLTYYSLGDYETIKKAYIDPYERIKEFYIEYRKEEVAD